jgi:hypothetical protein
MPENSPANAAQLPTTCPPDASTKPARRRAKGTTRPQLLSREQLDGRTNAAKMFDRLVAAIAVDMGGHDQCSTIQLQLIEAFAGAAVTLGDFNTRLALGQEIDLQRYAQTVTAMVRVATRLGLQRRARQVLSLRERLELEAEAEAEAPVQPQETT